jgi:hypothetical protein
MACERLQQRLDAAAEARKAARVDLDKERRPVSLKKNFGTSDVARLGALDVDLDERHGAASGCD